jgi:hypothetical protein
MQAHLARTEALLAPLEAKESVAPCQAQAVASWWRHLCTTRHKEHWQVAGRLIFVAPEKHWHSSTGGCYAHSFSRGADKENEHNSQVHSSTCPRKHGPRSKGAPQPGQQIVDPKLNFSHSVTEQDSRLRPLRGRGSEEYGSFLRTVRVVTVECCILELQQVVKYKRRRRRRISAKSHPCTASAQVCTT